MSEYATSVVRLFPDHAESVVCFRGPVPYEDTRLDPRLIVELQAWDASYDAGLTADLAWRAAGVEAAFRAEGARLARAERADRRAVVERARGAGETLEWRAEP